MTSRGTWEKYESNKVFGEFYKTTFRNSSVEISRGDLFKLVAVDFNAAIFSIVLWGYPRNMRGNSFEELLKNIDKLKILIHGKTQFDEEEFLQMKRLLKGTGIGLSTLSKFLYFFNIKFCNTRSLILDSRIISVLQERKFKELHKLSEITEFKKDDYYIKYIKLMADISKKYNYEVDQLELFLFMFGSNLKGSDR